VTSPASPASAASTASDPAGRPGADADAPEAHGTGPAPTLSIVVPAYDEAARLPATLASVAEHVRVRGLDAEVVIVDDGSTDGTAEVARHHGATHGLALRVLRHAPNRGKGYAVRVGMLAARGDAVLLTDADLSVPLDHLDAFRERLAANGTDAVIGSRRIAGAHIAVHQPARREWLGGVFRGLAALAVAPGTSDFTCGFKLFTRDAARAVFARQRLWGWGYDVEILFLARRLGLRVAEAPVTWSDDRRSRVRLWRDVPRSLADLVRIRWNALCGRYDAPADDAREGAAGSAAAAPRPPDPR